MTARVFANAGAQSTCTSPITAAQATVTLVSTTGFGSVPTGNVLDLIIIDSGAPLFDPDNPLAGNWEYQPGTSIAGNVVTFGGGTRADYAGTTPKAYSAGATIAAVTLAEGLRTLQGNLHGISVSQSAAQAINSGTFIDMPFDVVESDPEGRWDNANRRYTCPAVAGIIQVSLGWAHDGASCRVIASVKKNASADYARLADCTGVAAYGSRRIITAASDQIYPQVWQNSGVQVHNFTGFNLTFFAVQWLGEL